MIALLRSELRLAPRPSIMELDFQLLAGCLALLGLGFVMITSASSEVASVNTGSTLYYMSRHLIYVLLGVAAAMLTVLLPVGLWQRYSGTLLVASAFLLVLVLVPGIGREVNGSMRWIGFGLFNLQPSELAKLFVVVYLSGYLVRRQDEVREHWWGFLKPFMVLLPISFLLLMEPDFGATVVMMGAAVAMLFLGGVGMMRFLIMVGLAILAVYILVQTQEYRMQRLITFTDPWADQYGAGYQLTQALIAFGRGEWFGVGLGNSVQKQFYLPEAHTDFVFSVLAEELGLFGAFVTIGLFAFVGVRALYIGLRAEQAKLLHSAYMAYGLAFLWLGQFLINVGVNIGLLPTKGLTLPFLSYGGSSLIVTCASMAMLLRIDWETRAASLPAAPAKKKAEQADLFADEGVAHGR